MIQTIAAIVPGTVANIDRTPPIVNGITAKASQDEASVTVTLNAHDSESGITTIDWQCKKNSGEWKTTTDNKSTSSDKGTGDTSSSFTHEFTDLEEGTEYTFQAVVHNAADDQQATSETTNASTIAKGITPTIENIGDYVNYPIDINNDGKYTNDWRIFYVGQAEDGEAGGRIFLIAADYVAHTCEELSTAISDSGMERYSSKHYETYLWSRPPEYNCNDGRNPGSYSGKDQCSFPELFMPANQFCNDARGYFCSDHTSYANSQCASRLQCTGDWKTFAKEGYAECAIGGPTLNMWVESWNTQHGSESTLYANGQSSTYGYYVGKTATTKDYSQNLSGCIKGYNDTLYFPHQTFENDLNNDNQQEICYGYWLASESAGGTGFCLLSVTHGGYVSSAACNSVIYLGVRPVICLSLAARLKDSGSNTNRYYSIQYSCMTSDPLRDLFISVFTT